MEVEHRAQVRVAGVGAPLARRVGHHHLDLLGQRVRAVGQVDDVVVALAHLATVEPRQLGHLGQLRLRLREDGTVVGVVEAPHDLAAEFHVRHLVGAHRHPVGLVDDDVGGLQQRVAEEAVGAEVAVLELLLLLLERRHALQPGERREHGQQQVQLGVLRHLRLDEQHAFLGVEAGAEVIDGDFPHPGANLSRIRVAGGEGVPVGDEVEGLVVLLQLHPVIQGTEKVAQVQRAGRPHATQNPLFRHAVSLPTGRRNLWRKRLGRASGRNVGAVM